MLFSPIDQRISAVMIALSQGKIVTIISLWQKFTVKKDGEQYIDTFTYPPEMGVQDSTVGFLELINRLAVYLKHGLTMDEHAEIPTLTPSDQLLSMALLSKMRPFILPDFGFQSPPAQKDCSNCNFTGKLTGACRNQNAKEKWMKVNVFESGQSCIYHKDRKPDWDKPARSF